MKRFFSYSFFSIPILLNDFAHCTNFCVKIIKTLNDLRTKELGSPKTVDERERIVQIVQPMIMKNNYQNVNTQFDILLYFYSKCYLVCSFDLYSAQEGLEIVEDSPGRLQKPFKKRYKKFLKNKISFVTHCRCFAV